MRPELTIVVHYVNLNPKLVITALWCVGGGGRVNNRTQEFNPQKVNFVGGRRGRSDEADPIDERNAYVCGIVIV